MLGATKRSHNNLTCLVLFQSSISFVVVVVVVVVVVAYTLPVVVVVDAGLVVESRVAIGHVVLVGVVVVGVVCLALLSPDGCC